MSRFHVRISRLTPVDFVISFTISIVFRFLLSATADGTNTKVHQCKNKDDNGEEEQTHIEPHVDVPGYCQQMSVVKLSYSR